MIGTKIEWATDTINFWHGCSKVSEACRFCYAETLSRRFHRRADGSALLWGNDGQRLVRVPQALEELAKIRRRAARTGERPRVFINSMSDFFEDRRDLDDTRLAALQAMRVTPEVDFLLLTKRPDRILELLCMIEEFAWANRQFPGPSEMASWISSWLNGDAPRNIWLGTTVENQEAADRRIPELLKVPAAVRFLSCEPLLGPVNLPAAFIESIEFGDAPRAGIDWVICGGESGPNARPMHPDWARSLRDQCAAAGVPFFFKQWGEHAPIDQPWMQESNARLGRREQWLNLAGGQGFHGREVWRMRRVGKKAAGSLLDGQEHSDFPEPRP